MTFDRFFFINACFLGMNCGKKSRTVLFLNKRVLSLPVITYNESPIFSNTRLVLNGKSSLVDELLLAK